MKKEETLVFTMPTNNPIDFKYKFMGGIENIIDLKDYCTFSIIFQPPFTQELINEHLKELDKLGLHYKWQFKTYTFEKGKTPLIKMRQDCAMMVPNALFYAMLDDDMQFANPIEKETIGIQYLNGIYNLLVDDNISLCQILPPDCFNREKEKPKNITAATPDHKTYYTANGLILRGGIYYGFKGVMPADTINIYGGCQDVMMCLWRMMNNKISICIPNGLCYHYEHREQKGMHEYKWTRDMNNPECCCGWLHKQYGTTFGRGKQNYSDKYSHLAKKVIKGQFYADMDYDYKSITNKINNILKNIEE